MGVRVAVIGTRGIGKFHARWFVWEGAELVGICSSREETAWLRRDELQEQIGYDGPAYSDVATMLREQRPEVVSIATPAPLHARHVALCLEADCHVLCEKPFVYDPERHALDCLGDAVDLVHAADARGLTLAVMTQYASLAPSLRTLGELAAGPDAGIWHFGMRMESRHGAGGQIYENVLMDLGSHPLALARALVPGLVMLEDTLAVSVERYRTLAAFDCMAPSETGMPEHRLSVALSLGKSNEPTREIEVNGLRLSYEGRPDEDGGFRAFLTCGDIVAECEDPMRQTVRSFLAHLAGEPAEGLSVGTDALATLDMLYTLERATLTSPVRAQA